MIWARVSKEVFDGPDVYSLGVDDAAAHFNIGVSAGIQVLRNMACLNCLNMAVLKLKGGGGGGKRRQIEGQRRRNLCIW